MKSAMISSRKLITVAFIALVICLYATSSGVKTVSAYLSPGTSYHIDETNTQYDPGAYIKYSVTTQTTYINVYMGSSYADYSIQNDAEINSGSCSIGEVGCAWWIQSTARIDDYSDAQQFGCGSYCASNPGWYPVSGGIDEDYGTSSGGEIKSFCNWQLSSGEATHDVATSGWQIQTIATIVTASSMTYYFYIWLGSTLEETINTSCTDYSTNNNFYDTEGLVVGPVSGQHVTFKPLSTNPLFSQYIVQGSYYSSMTYKSEGSETLETSNLYNNPTAEGLHSGSPNYYYEVSSNDLTETST